MANMAQAIRMALHMGEKHLEVREIFGQDVGPPLGGVFTVTQGLATAWNTPLDERGIVGAAMGVAMAGQRVVAEVQFCDYIFNTIDLLKMVGNTSWACRGQYNLPLVLMTPVGAGIHGSIYHSHSFDAWATRMPGWVVVMPSRPLEAYALMLSAIKNPNPVLYLKPKSLLRVKSRVLLPGEPAEEKALKKAIDAPIGVGRKNWRPKWPESLELMDIKLPSLRVVRPGKDLCVVSYGRYVLMCEEAILELEREHPGTRIELIDLFCLYPYDWQSLKQSIKKCGKVLFVNEDTEVTNFAEHLAYRATRELFYTLHAPPKVLAGLNTPGIGLHPDLEKATVPQVADIKRHAWELLQAQV